MCQGTGKPRTIVANKGQQVLDRRPTTPMLSRGVLQRSPEKSPLLATRRSALCARSTPHESPGANPPLYARKRQYEFLFVVANGGGSANKMFLFRRRKGAAESEDARKFVTDNSPTSSPRVFPPYHLVFACAAARARNCFENPHSPRLKSLDLCLTTGTNTAALPRSRGKKIFLEMRRPAKSARSSRKIFCARRAGGSACRATARAVPSAGRPPAARRPQHQGEDHKEGSGPSRWKRIRDVSFPRPSAALRTTDRPDRLNRRR